MTRFEEGQYICKLLYGEEGTLCLKLPKRYLWEVRDGLGLVASCSRMWKVNPLRIQSGEGGSHAHLRRLDELDR